MKRFALAWTIISTLLAVHPFALQRIVPRSCRRHHHCDKHQLQRRTTTTRLFDAERREVWEADLEETKSALGRINALEALVDKEDVNLDELSNDVKQLEDEIGQLPFILPAGLSAEDFVASMRVFSTLPLSLKLGLYFALKMNDEDAPYPTLEQYPEIVSRLYEDRLKLTAQKLEDGVKEAEDMLKKRRSLPSLRPSLETNAEMDTEEILKELLDGKTLDQAQNDNVVKQQLGRVTRKEGKGATPADLETLMGVLEGSFVVRGAPEEIPGGYVIRGSNRRPSPKELIAILDKKLPSNWNAQVSYLQDITSEGVNSDGEVEPVLVLLNNDFSSESSWLLPLSAGLACVSTFLYGISAYAKNENMALELADRNALGDFSGVDWFNGHLIEIFFPLFLIQALHEFGHFLIAQKDKIDTSLPALIPFYDKLPNLGTRTNLKSSPPNLTSLFDFAFVGPLMGILTSLIFLVYGVQATLLADAQTLQFFPSLTVEEIRYSTLGGGIVDYLFGGSGVVTNQDPKDVIQLHPFALAGFTGLIIQSLEMLPLGSTDGGRMSQSIFGRKGHLIVGGGTWIALLVATLFVDANSDILLFAWAVNNVCQNDMEIPCREEVTQVDAFRSVAGFGLWFVAVLALAPMQ